MPALELFNYRKTEIIGSFLKWTWLFSVIFFLAVLSFDVWGILVIEQPSLEEWHIAIQSRSCPDLKS
jgi:hypothetical protein